MLRTSKFDRQMPQGSRKVSRLVTLSIPILSFCQLTSSENLYAATHPLDPLGPCEIIRTTRFLRKSGHARRNTKFVYISRGQPPKESVYRWSVGEPIQRIAAVVVRDENKVYEGTVDIGENRVLEWKPVPGAQTRILVEEYALADKIIKSDSRWREAMRKRGFRSYTKIRNIHYAAGHSGESEPDTRRLIHAVSYDERRESNFWGRPIEGVFVVVDLDEKEVVELIDTGAVPIPGVPVDYDEESVGELREIPTPISLKQEEGPSYRIEGNFIHWQHWRFHFRIDPRLGMIFSLISYQDAGKQRSILYEASLSELFVPYMDPSPSWRSRTYFDIGDYGLGLSLSSIERGRDCPELATLKDAVLHNDKGKPVIYKNILAIFERTSGNPAWRHYNFSKDRTESRKSRELVLRTIATLGNYDYIFDWIFLQNGTIRVAVGSTGVVAVKAVEASGALSQDTFSSDAYGRLVDRNLLAVNHDHYFSFRLDFDIDGDSNSFEKGHLETRVLPEDSIRRSLWTMRPEIALVESDAKLRINLERPVLWRVINSDVLSAVGYPVSYMIKPRDNALPLLSLDDFPQKRAGFTNYHLWVTPYNTKERFAAGDYTLRSRGGEGLPTWTKANRPIANTDIVVWYTLGFHHVVRSEDWPIMPLAWGEFELKPFNFFPRNPAIDIPDSE